MTENTIKSPLPGTFYRKPSPDADPYVFEGDEVKEGEVIGLVEIMKNFHEVQSDQSGVIDRFLVETDDVVEAGQDIALLR